MPLFTHVKIVLLSHVLEEQLISDVLYVCCIIKLSVAMFTYGLSKPPHFLHKKENK